jgi:hypothetical protein
MTGPASGFCPTQDAYDGYTLSKPKVISIVGDPDSGDAPSLLNVVRDGCQLFQVVALDQTMLFHRS